MCRNLVIGLIIVATTCMANHLRAEEDNSEKTLRDEAPSPDTREAGEDASREAGEDAASPNTRETEDEAPSPDTREAGEDASREAGNDASQGAEDSSPQDTKGSSLKEKAQPMTIPWRRDPSVRRRPGSYIGGGIGYLQGRAWYRPAEDEFDESIGSGALHGWQGQFRVGDALFEWLAMGLQIDLGTTGYGSSSTMSAFTLLLDVTFYPYKGLGIRPSAGIGFSFTQGSEDYKMGFGGPGCLSLALTYEIRITKLFVIAPLAQVYWIAGEDYNALNLSFGIEFIKWFAAEKK